VESDEDKKPDSALLRELKRIQDEAAGFRESLSATGAQRYLDAMTRALSSELPKMDSVISSSVASGMDLRSLVGDVGTPTRYEPILPLKSGTEYAIERVEREVSRLAGIAAGMADNTGANAQIAKTGLEQSIALVALLRDLHATTRQGIDANDRSARSLIWLTRVLAVLTIEIIVVTLILVLRAN
jgi:hypothetical protein